MSLWVSALLILVCGMVLGALVTSPIWAKVAELAVGRVLDKMIENGHFTHRDVRYTVAPYEEPDQPVYARPQGPMKFRPGGERYLTDINEEEKGTKH